MGGFVLSSKRTRQCCRASDCVESCSQACREPLGFRLPLNSGYTWPREKSLQVRYMVIIGRLCNVEDLQHRLLPKRLLVPWLLGEATVMDGIGVIGHVGIVVCLVLGRALCIARILLLVGPSRLHSYNRRPRSCGSH